MIRWTSGLILILMWLLPALGVVPASQTVPKPDGRFIAYPQGAPDLRSPGFHKLIYEWKDAGHAKQIRFSIFLPHGYGTDHRRWPMLTFLAGATV